MTFFAKPLVLLLEVMAALSNLAQLDDVAWAVRELILALVGNQDPFGWVHVYETSVGLQAGSVNFFY